MRKAIPVAAATAALLAVVGIMLVRNKGAGDVLERLTGVRSSSGLRPEWINPAGTPLGDGMSVPAGTVQLGAVKPSEIGPGGHPSAWSAVLAVTGDPLQAWQELASQFAAKFPQDDIDPRAIPGCRRELSEKELPTRRGTPFHCSLYADGLDREGLVTFWIADLFNTTYDVTGHYLIHLGAARSRDDKDSPPARLDPWPGREAPPPLRPQPRPRTGEPLSPETTAYEGDDRRYVLLEGSDLVARLGAGSLTGGFSVLLAVRSGYEVGDLARAYSKQAAQGEGEERTEVGNLGETSLTILEPPGGAGGYQGRVTAIDQPGDRDFIFYGLTND